MTRKAENDTELAYNKTKLDGEVDTETRHEEKTNNNENKNIEKNKMDNDSNDSDLYKKQESYNIKEKDETVMEEKKEDTKEDDITKDWVKQDAINRIGFVFIHCIMISHSWYNWNIHKLRFYCICKEIPLVYFLSIIYHVSCVKQKPCIWKCL